MKLVSAAGFEKFWGAPNHSRISDRVVWPASIHSTRSQGISPPSL
jgi:hypothetical protein